MSFDRLRTRSHFKSISSLQIKAHVDRHSFAIECKDAGRSPISQQADCALPKHKRRLVTKVNPRYPTSGNSTRGKLANGSTTRGPLGSFDNHEWLRLRSSGPRWRAWPLCRPKFWFGQGANHGEPMRNRGEFAARGDPVCPEAPVEQTAHSRDQG